LRRTGETGPLLPGLGAGAHSLSVRSAGSRPVSCIGLWGSSRSLPLFPGENPGLERRRDAGENRAQLGEASGALVRRERSDAAWRRSLGRIFGDGIGPALALVCGSARITSAHKNPLPVRRVLRGSPRPVAWWPSGLGIKESNEPRGGVDATAGFVLSNARSVPPQYPAAASLSGCGWTMSGLSVSSMRLNML
jgi:hypothetical protein